MHGISLGMTLVKEFHSVKAGRARIGFLHFKYVYLVTPFVAFTIVNYNNELRKTTFLCSCASAFIFGHAVALSRVEDSLELFTVFLPLRRHKKMVEILNSSSSIVNLPWQICVG